MDLFETEEGLLSESDLGLVVGSAEQTSGGVNQAASATEKGSGNAQLESAFNTAIQEAAKTMTISVTGQAQLNALRARPKN